MGTKPVINPGKRGRPPKFTKEELTEIVQAWNAPDANRSRLACELGLFPQSLRLMVKRYLAEHETQGQ